MRAGGRAGGPDGVPLESLAAEVDVLRGAARRLAAVPTGALLDWFDSLGLRWADEAPRSEAWRVPGIAYATAYLRRSHLEPLLREALRGEVGCLDRFVARPGEARAIGAFARGVVTHWAPGNVPWLGLFSLVQGLLTRNANIVKVPGEWRWLLPAWLDLAAGHTATLADGSRLSGASVAGAALCVSCERSDRAAHAALSAVSDVRVVWGGDEAIAGLRDLPRPARCEDVVFGPRESLAVVGREALAPDRIGALCDAIAIDAVVFAQRGCNAPHLVAVERGGETPPRAFAGRLAAAMDAASRRLPPVALTAGEAYAVVGARAAHRLRGEVFASPGTEWTVLFDEASGPAVPVGGRVVTVRAVSEVEEVLAWIGARHQTVGLALDGARGERFARAAAAAGVDRIVPPGGMRFHDSPWDGTYLADRLVRWVVRQ